MAANVAAHGTGGLNIDTTRIGGGAKKWAEPRGGIWATDSAAKSELVDNPLGRWPANVVLSHSPECREAECSGSCPVALLDAQSGERKTGVCPADSGGGYRGFAPRRNGVPAANGGDTGGASRFFATFKGDSNGDHAGRTGAVDGNGGGARSECAEGCEPLARQDHTILAEPLARFRYCAKASRREREAGLEGMPQRLAPKHNIEGRDPDKPSNYIGAYEGYKPAATANVHPTVKPLALMRWLCRLVTPPGGLILDPFTGSGSTGCAAVLEGFRFLGIEREAEYVAIAERRIAHWASQNDPQTELEVA